MNRLDRRVGLSGRHAVPSLLETVRGRTTKPVKEVAIDAPPLSDSDEEDDTLPGDAAAEHSDSSDQEPRRRGDIVRTNFGKKDDPKTKQASKRGGSAASNNDIGRSTRGSERRVPKGKPSSYGRKSARDHDDAIEDSGSDDARATKRARITKRSDMIGTHMKGDPFAKPKKKTAKNTYKSKLQVPQKLDFSDSPTSPRKTLKLGREPSAEVSPERKKLVIPRRAAKDASTSPLMTATLKFSKEDSDSDNGSGKKRKPLRRQGLKNRNETILEGESQRPVFKLPGSYSKDDARDDTNAGGTIDHDLASVLSSPLSSPIGSGEPVSTPSVCPMCDEAVDPEFLKSFSKDSRMTINQQTKFCRLHKKRSAQEAWTSRGYPDIKWESLESRVAECDEYLRSLIGGQTSYFGELLSEKIKSGKSRTLFRSEESLTPGYYGLRGLRTMTELIVERYSSLLRQRAPKYRLISARGHTAYVQSVLVPELTVRLIKNDMKVNSEEARKILESSRSIGELLNDEKGDQVLRTHDSTDEELEEEDIGSVNEIDEDSDD